MSTVLVDTNGGSVFQNGSDVIDTGTQIGRDVSAFTKKFQLSLTNADNKPILKPVRRVIDVVNDFSWYAGPKATTEALNKVPCVFLTEREQLLSSLIAGALYYLNATASTVKALGGSDYVKSVLGRLSESSQDTLTDLGSDVADFLDSVQSRAGGTSTDRSLLEQNNLKSLQGIYFTKPTGFQYRLPIYGSPSQPSSSWGEQSKSGIVGKVVGAGQDVIRNISQAVNFAQPGVYIEPPKYFQNVEGRTESITFPLTNTVRRNNFSPIQQNYELLWLLAFQNKAYKTSFARTPPPKIYSVVVPGQFSMPYAYISSMSVDFIGTIRKTSVFVPSGNGEGIISSKQITTNVPEAYQVTLNFTSLIGEYGNTMLSDAFNTNINGNTLTIGNK